MTQVLAIGFLAIWFVSAVLLGIVMHRRGYNGWGWGVIGVALGPLGVLLALLYHASPPPDRWTQTGLTASGPVDVLIGTDGSPAALVAAQAAITVLGERLGRVTIAAAAPFDANADDESRAQAALEATRAALADQLTERSAVPGAVVLHGRPADALRARARDGGYELIAVGSHGHGASAAILGSVTSALVERSELPLLVTGRVLRSPSPAADDRDAMTGMTGATA